MNVAESERTVALSITVGFGEFGKEVIDDLKVFYEVLPSELKCAWRILKVDSGETTENLKVIGDITGMARSSILQKQNIAYIIDKGYKVEGRDRKSEIRICNVYVWCSEDFGSRIPAFILDSIEQRPNEIHTGFCFEKAEGDVDLSNLDVPKLFAYYLVQDTLHTGARVGRSEVVSSISGTVLTGFLPNNGFDISKNRGSVSTIGFSGKYGFIWSSKNILARMIADKLVNYQFKKSVRDMELEGLTDEMKAVVRAVNPQEIGLRLFDPEAAGIQTKFRIPATPKWASNTFDIDMDSNALSCELHDSNKSEWPGQIRSYTSAFDMTAAWKWRMILGKAGRHLSGEALSGFLPAIRNILDSRVFAPASAEFLVSSVEGNCDGDRRASGSRDGSLNSVLAALKKKTTVQLDPRSYFLRVLLWMLPVASILAVSVHMAIPRAGGAVGLLAGFVALGAAYLHFHRKLKASGSSIVAARDSAVSEMRAVQSCRLSQNAVHEMEIIASKIRALLQKAREDLSKYKSNLNAFINSNRSKYQRIEGEKYAVLSPILESVEEYKHIINSVVDVDTESLVKKMIEDTAIMKGLYLDSWSMETFDSVLCEFCLNEINLGKDIRYVPSFRDILRIKSEVNESSRDHTLDKVLRDLISYTIPMTSRDSIGTEELIIGTPSDLIENVESQMKEQGFSGEPTVLDMGEYPLLFCISRVIIQTERGRL